MIHDSRLIFMVLRSIAGHPRPLVPIFPREYNKYFGEHILPIEKRIKDKEGYVNILMVSREKAKRYLKDTYGFQTKEETAKELKNANNDHIRRKV